MPIKSRIRTIEHYPKPGVMFRDITTLLKDPIGLRLVIDAFAERYREMEISKVCAIESRGFIVGAPVAYLLGIGFVPIRKAGKLPGETVGLEYALEYGEDRVEIHVDAIEPGERVVVIDDLIATGGTAEASVRLLREIGADVVECGFIVDLPDLGGTERLRAQEIASFALCEFEGE